MYVDDLFYTLMSSTRMSIEDASGRTLKAIKYRRGSLEVLNQLLLPWESVYEEVKGVEDGHAAIKTMKVGHEEHEFEYLILFLL